MHNLQAMHSSKKSWRPKAYDMTIICVILFWCMWLSIMPLRPGSIVKGVCVMCEVPGSSPGSIKLCFSILKKSVTISYKFSSIPQWIYGRLQVYILQYFMRKKHCMIPILKISKHLTSIKALITTTWSQINYF